MLNLLNTMGYLEGFLGLLKVSHIKNVSFKTFLNPVTIKKLHMLLLLTVKTCVFDISIKDQAENIIQSHVLLLFQ